MKPDAAPRRADTAPPVTRQQDRPSDNHGAVLNNPLETLLPLALSRPADALATGLRVVATSSDPHELSIAHQAIAIVLRDRGISDQAVRHAFTALRLARRVSDERRADVLATLGIVLAFAGRTADGLRRFDEAAPLTSLEMLPRLQYRRAHVLVMLARYEEALEELTRAITGSRSIADQLWEGRALNARCDVHLARGELREAEVDALRAESLLTSAGQEFEAAQSRHNRGLVAHARGDLPAALTLLDEAAERYSALGNVRHDLIIERTQVMLTAGLIGEARELCEVTLPGTRRAPIRRAELLLSLALAALMQGDTTCAEENASEAGRLFASQKRQGWYDRAMLLRLRARFVDAHPVRGPWMLDEIDLGEDAPPPPPGRARRLLRDAEALVESLQGSAGSDLAVALVLYGQIAADTGLDAVAEKSLRAAAAARQAGPPLSRAAGWLAAALLAQHRQDRRALYLACRRGLDAVDEHRNVLGDLELRALASGHGIEFPRLAVAEAVRTGRPRDILWWAERWRAAALNDPAAKPSDPGLLRDLAALRDVARRLGALDSSDSRAAALMRERSRLEAAIRAAHRHLRAESPHDGAVERATAGLDLDTVFAELGNERALINVIRDRNVLHLVVVARRRTRHVAIGPARIAERESDFARFALRRAAYGRAVDLEHSGNLLQKALLGEPFALPTGVREVVVVPSAELLTVPWGLLPALREVVLTVSPSVSQWIRARRAPGALESQVALVTGPHLTTREAEVANLRRLHRRVRVLPSEQATAAAALEALEGASLAHIAAHGFFRADAPLFSSLELADGPLTVHDLRQLERPPRSLVLSACDSGGAAPIGSYEALGLVSSLLGMGSRTLLAAVVPVNDHACLSLMAEVHGVVAGGGTVAEGWLAARRAAAGDPLLTATAASFTAWGA